MKHTIRLHRLLVAAFLAAAAASSLVQLAQAGPPAPAVPGKIRVADGNKVFSSATRPASRSTGAR
jgi:hypothetical protein